jgi:hypothetical protein
MTDKCDLDFYLSFHAQLSVYHLGQWNYICNILRHGRTKCFWPLRSISKKVRGINFRPVMIIFGNCTSDFESPGNYFLSGAKNIMGHFLEFFEGASTFLTPSKNPANYPIMCLACKKIISRTFKISGTLIGNLVLIYAASPVMSFILFAFYNPGLKCLEVNKNIFPCY